MLVPIVTPCTRSGEIDVESLVSVVEEMVEAGAAGIFVVGSTGRGPWFPSAAQEVVCRTVADHLGSRAPVFAGCMATGLSDMAQKARMFADAGAKVAVAS